MVWSSSPEKKASGGKGSKYDELIRDNKLLFTLDLVKESLDEAYRQEMSPRFPAASPGS